MKIKEIVNQHRRDFTAIYECEHCQNTETKGGYDDSYFHIRVIPEMICSRCKRKGAEDYILIGTRYPDGTLI